jgi:hypothetical protein
MGTARASVAGSGASWPMWICLVSKAQLEVLVTFAMMMFPFLSVVWSLLFGHLLLASARWRARQRGGGRAKAFCAGLLRASGAEEPTLEYYRNRFCKIKGF